jgi:hypothetical protein
MPLKKKIINKMAQHILRTSFPVGYVAVVG